MVEGSKIIREVIQSPFKITEIYAVNPLEFKNSDAEVFEISHTELKKISFLKNPKDALALCKLPENTALTEKKRQIILDGVQDPGNLGTIIRLADWFGIEQIVCSIDTVDVYNPKVLMASMASFCRVNLIYMELEEFFEKTTNVNIATKMEGKNLYHYDFPENFNLILGNEGNGIRTSTFQFVKESISIPQFGATQNTESLNVSMAAGIILGQIFSKNN